jgi:hypothetical protein
LNGVRKVDVEAQNSKLRVELLARDGDWVGLFVTNKWFSIIVHPDSDMPDNATGLEKREVSSGGCMAHATHIVFFLTIRQQLDAIARGEELFGESILTGPFGTPSHPVIVKSVFDTRITGCVGGKDNSHELIWHVVTHVTKHFD